MGKIYLLVGKSSSGKDSLRRKILSDVPSLRTYIPYTTRPRRRGEKSGDEYYFVNDCALDALRGEGKVIEERTYETVHGPWTYATVDDGQINLSSASVLMEGTLQSLGALREHFGKDSVVPLYIEVDDGERLLRAILREQSEAAPRYAEVCRRFLADSEDFSEEKLRAAGIDIKFVNDDIFSCADRIKEVILRDAGL